MEDDAISIIERHQEKMVPIIKKYLADKTVLDVGCGTGLNAFLFNEKFNAQVTLVDVEDVRSEHTLHFPFTLTSIDDLSQFTPEEFDVAFVQYVLHHLPPKIQLNHAIEELKRVSKRLIIAEEVITEKTDIAVATAYDEKVNKLLHPASSNTKVYRYYTDQELRDIFNKAGLVLIKHQVLDTGCEDNGYLQRIVYVLE